jgi:hypothetical protein
MPNKKTKEEILKLFKDKWGDEFDYSLAVFNGMSKKVDIIHNKCGTQFKQKPSDHMQSKVACRVCLNAYKKGKPRKVKKINDFITEANEIHHYAFDYSNAVYINNHTDMIIKHNECGETFKQTPADHLTSKICCPSCVKEKRKISKEIWLERFKIKWGDEYDYSQAIFNKAADDIIITHQCGYTFLQSPNIHSYHGCPKCGGTMKKEAEEYLMKFKEKWDDEFDYSEADINGCNKKIIIKHNVCQNIFKITPHQHLSLIHSCRYCSFKESAIKRTYTQEEFEEICNHKHNNQYDYSEFIYKTGDSYGWITHLKCGHRFCQKAKNHMVGKGCKECSKINMKLALTKTQDEFLEEAHKVHGDAYDYSQANYVLNNIPVILTHKKCGYTFEQRPSNHLFGAGCHKCKSSRGELFVCRYLDHYHIKYEIQKKFDNCRNILPLPFDVYVPHKNVCIEVNGCQHYIPVDFFGGIESYKQRVINDNIKINYCENNNIKLFIIRYDEDILEAMNKIYDYLIN